MAAVDPKILKHVSKSLGLGDDGLVSSKDGSQIFLTHWFKSAVKADDAVKALEQLDSAEWKSMNRVAEYRIMVSGEKKGEYDVAIDREDFDRIARMDPAEIQKIMGTSLTDSIQLDTNFRKEIDDAARAKVEAKARKKTDTENHYADFNQKLDDAHIQNALRFETESDANALSNKLNNFKPWAVTKNVGNLSHVTYDREAKQYVVNVNPDRLHNYRNERPIDGVITIVADHRAEVEAAAAAKEPLVKKLGERIGITATSHVQITRNQEVFTVEGLTPGEAQDVATSLNKAINGASYLKDGKLHLNERVLNDKNLTEMNAIRESNMDVARERITGINENLAKQAEGRVQEIKANNQANEALLNGSFISQKKGATWSTHTIGDAHKGIRRYVASGKDFDNFPDRNAALEKVGELNRAYGFTGDHGFAMQELNGKPRVVMLPLNLNENGDKATIQAADQKAIEAGKTNEVADKQYLPLLNGSALSKANGVTWKAAEDKSGNRTYIASGEGLEGLDRDAALAKATALNAAFGFEDDKPDPKNPGKTTGSGFAVTTTADGTSHVSISPRRLEHRKGALAIQGEDQAKADAVKQIEGHLAAATSEAATARINAKKISDLLTKTEKGTTTQDATIERLTKEIAALKEQENPQAAVEKLRAEKTAADAAAKKADEAAKKEEAENVNFELEQELRKKANEAAAAAKAATDKLTTAEEAAKKVTPADVEKITAQRKAKEAELDTANGTRTTTTGSIETLRKQAAEANELVVAAEAARDAIKEPLKKAQAAKSVAEAQAEIEPAKTQAGLAKDARLAVSEIAKQALPPAEVEKTKEEKEADKKAAEGTRPGDQAGTGTPPAGAGAGAGGGTTTPQHGQEAESSNWWGMGLGIGGFLLMMLMGMDPIVAILGALLMAAAGSFFGDGDKGVLSQTFGIGTGKDGNERGKGQALDVFVERQNSKGEAIAMEVAGPDGKPATAKDLGIPVDKDGNIVMAYKDAKYIAYGKVSNDDKSKFEITHYRNAADVLNVKTVAEAEALPKFDAPKGTVVTVEPRVLKDNTTGYIVPNATKFAELVTSIDKQAETKKIEAFALALDKNKDGKISGDELLDINKDQKRDEKDFTPEQKAGFDALLKQNKDAVKKDDAGNITEIIVPAGLPLKAPAQEAKRT